MSESPIATIRRVAEAIGEEIERRAGGDEFLDGMDDDVRAEFLDALALRALAEVDG